jgi:putative acetyltransferase
MHLPLQVCSMPRFVRLLPKTILLIKLQRGVQAEGRIFLVAENDAGEPVGYTDLELDGHIDHLYCRPDVVGSGVGSALYLALEALARERGIPSLFVEASEAARRLFERHGFKIESRNDFEIAGVPIHNYRMSKSI